MAIIEEPAIPERVITPRTFVEETVRGPVKLVQSVEHVTASVGMNQIKQHSQTKAVRRVHQALQVFRCAKSARNGEEMRHLIAETRVERMLHDAHELQTIVAKLSNTRQDMVGKIAVAGYLEFGRSNSHW